jgi:hypothetical protein
MPDSTCSTCGQPMQGDVCVYCLLASAIAKPEHAAQAKVTPPNDGSIREGGAAAEIWIGSQSVGSTRRRREEAIDVGRLLSGGFLRVGHFRRGGSAGDLAQSGDGFAVAAHGRHLDSLSRRGRLLRHWLCDSEVPRRGGVGERLIGAETEGCTTRVKCQSRLAGSPGKVAIVPIAST